MADGSMRVKKVVPIGSKQGNSQEGPSGKMPKNAGGKRSSGLFDGTVDERYRGGKPGLPYSGS